MPIQPPLWPGFEKSKDKEVMDSFMLDLVDSVDINSKEQDVEYDPTTGIANFDGITINIGQRFRYMHVMYADDANGTGLSNIHTDKFFYALRNTDDATESTNPADYTYTEVAGGFGSTKTLYYRVHGNRVIEFEVDTTKPADFVAVPTDAIDLDQITDGTSARIDIAYADSDNNNSYQGTVFPTGTFDNDDYTPATPKTTSQFIGVRTIGYNTTEPAPSATVSDYEWVKIRGEDGTNVYDDQLVPRIQYRIKTSLTNTRGLTTAEVTTALSNVSETRNPQTNTVIRLIDDSDNFTPYRYTGTAWEQINEAFDTVAITELIVETIDATTIVTEILQAGDLAATFIDSDTAPTITGQGAFIDSEANSGIGSEAGGFFHDVERDTSWLLGRVVGGGNIVDNSTMEFTDQIHTIPITRSDDSENGESNRHFYYPTAGATTPLTQLQLFEKPSFVTGQYAIAIEISRITFAVTGNPTLTVNLIPTQCNFDFAIQNSAENLGTLTAGGSVFQSLQFWDSIPSQNNTVPAGVGTAMRPYIESNRFFVIPDNYEDVRLCIIGRSSSSNLGGRIMLEFTGDTNVTFDNVTLRVKTVRWYK